MDKENFIYSNKILEYNNLRKEIDDKIKMHNSFLTFTITTVVAVLTFALSNGIHTPFLCLVPFGILIPMSMRITYYRSAIVKLAAYMVVFLECDLDGLNWETRNNRVLKKLKKKEKIDLRSFAGASYYECLILAIVCYFCYIYVIVQNRKADFSFEGIWGMLWPLIFVAAEVYSTYRLNSANSAKEEWIEKWQEIKNEEGKVNETASSLSE